MKKFQKIIITTILCSQITTLAYANEIEEKPYYINTVDIKNSDFENGNWKYKFTTSDKLSLILEEGKRHTFLIINGKILTENIIIKNDISFIPLNTISKELNLQEEKPNTFKIGLDTITIDNNSLYIKKNNEILPTKAIKIENKIYVPLREFVNAVNGTVSYTTSDIMPLYNPLICVDNREQKITKEQALQLAKQTMNQCYKNFLPNLENNNNISDEVLNKIKEKINKIHHIKDTACFWVIEGPYLLLVDKTTGDIYYKTGHGKAGHGSYVETIQKVDINSTDFFEYIINQGF